MRKVFIKTISIILAVVMVISGSLVTTFAINTEPMNNIEKVSINGESAIIDEIESLRSEFEKHFLREDGSYVVATYSNPVHYEEDGEWKEINNNLILTNDEKSESGNAMYVTKSSPTSISIPQSFSNEQKISATNKGYTISFGVNNTTNAQLSKTATIINDVNNLSSIKNTNDVSLFKTSSVTSANTTTDEKSKIETYNNDIMTVKNQAGAVVYEDIFCNTDLEYIVTTNSIKENIVVNEQQGEYIYSFEMNFGELTPIVHEDNSISLVESQKSNEVIFYIEAPYMYDANGFESNDIDMSLVKNDDTYIMTLKANSTWINHSDRAFPVIIDPTVYLSFNDVFVINGLYNGSPRVKKELRVGRNLTNLTRTYIKPTMPTNIPTGSYIDEAYLSLKQNNYYSALGAEEIDIKAFDCCNVDYWSPDSISWKEQPVDNSNNGYENSNLMWLSSVQASPDTDTYLFNIKEAVARWLNTGNNNGIMLASSDESTKTQVDFYSSRATNSDNYPEMYITYVAPSIDISNWETNSQPSEKSFTINVGNYWTAYTDVDWITLSETSGTPDNGSSTNQIIVTENTSVENRTGNVIIKTGNTVIGTITVTQLGTEPSLILSKDDLFVSHNNFTQTINVTSNVNWQPYTDDTWISFEKEIIGDGDYKLNISVTENNTNLTRVGEIVIQSNYAEPQIIKITQLDQVTGYFYEINTENTAITWKESSEYNHALATWSMYLSNAAYNPLPDDMLLNIPESFMTDPTTIESVLTNNNFENIEQYHYDESQINTAAHTIAHKKIINVDGSYKTLITIAVRGTAASIEWLTDIASFLQDQQTGFLGAKNDVLVNLNEYLETYENCFEDERIILVTGHSLGAAVANLVGDALNNSEEWGSDNVYAYTFATPNVGNQLNSEHFNIFNILNRNDIVTLLPFSLIPSAIAGEYLWGRHGIDIPISMERGEDVPTNHKMDTYYNFMISQEPTLNFVGIMAISNNDVRMDILPKLLSMKCPVGVTIYNDVGEIMAYESQQATATYLEEQTAVTSDVVSWISEDGEKVFFIPYGSDASSVSIEAYDYGTMTFSIAKVDALTNHYSEIKTFNNISLYPEKEFSLGLSEYVSIANTRLYVVENGTIVDEITDLNPPLKSVTVDNTYITYGTPTTITITTDKEVSEVRLINTIDESSLYYTLNNSNDIIVTENEDNLTWIIHTTFSTGNWVYDVSVKLDDTWYTTSKVFEIMLV